MNVGYQLGKLEIFYIGELDCERKEHTHASSSEMHNGSDDKAWALNH